MWYNPSEQNEITNTAQSTDQRQFLLMDYILTRIHVLNVITACIIGDMFFDTSKFNK